MLAAIGWVATAVFAASYFFQKPAALRGIQAAAACLWVVYGFMIGALPVVVANVIVAAAALYSAFPRRLKSAELLRLEPAAAIGVGQDEQHHEAGHQPH